MFIINLNPKSWRMVRRVLLIWTPGFGRSVASLQVNCAAASRTATAGQQQGNSRATARQQQHKADLLCPSLTFSSSITHAIVFLAGLMWLQLSWGSSLVYDLGHGLCQAEGGVREVLCWQASPCCPCMLADPPTYTLLTPYLCLADRLFPPFMMAQHWTTLIRS